MTADLPPRARVLVAVTRDAVRAAQDRDGDAFDAATARLAALDPEQVRLVLGTVVRSLLEERHPDGLDAADVRAALEGCVRSASGWLPSVNAEALVVVVTGALGVHDPEQTERPVTTTEIAVNAPLLVATLLDGAARPVAVHLADAVAEIARAQTVEMP